MTKLDFLFALQSRLEGLPKDEVRERIGFYAEMIEDRMEEGNSEEAAVAAVGSVEEIAAQIAADIGGVPAEKPRTPMKAWKVVLLVLGLVLFAAGMTALGWDFSRLGTGKLVTNTHDVSQGFEDIILETDTADVTFLPAADGKCTVVCREWEKEQHKVFVEDGSLTIRLEDKRAWYEHIGIHFDTPTLTVYLPEGQYGSLNIKTDTGKVKIQGVSAERLTVEVSTGNTILQDIACGSLAALGDTGDISLENVTARELLRVVRDTGDVRLTRCDGGEISIKTDTGDVSGSLLSEKVFSVHSDTGRVNVPKSVAGGPCEITTDTGDIKITIAD